MWTLLSVEDSDDPTRTKFTESMVIDGDSSALSWTIYSNNLNLIAQDTSVTVGLTFDATQMAVTYSEQIEVQFLIAAEQAPCLSEQPVIALEPFADILYGVQTQSPTEQLAVVTVVSDTHDCLGTVEFCGQRLTDLLFTTQAMALQIDDSVLLEDLLLTLAPLSTAQSGVFSVVLRVAYEFCPDSVAEQTFSLQVACSNKNTIYLTTSPAQSLHLHFDFFADSSVTLAFDYSHALCEQPEISYEDQN